MNLYKKGMGWKIFNKKIFFLLILYNTVAIFYSLVPSVIVMVSTFFIMIYFFGKLEKSCGVFRTLYYCSLLSIPTSFISVFGKSYSEFPLSWFQIFILSMVLYMFFWGCFDRYYFFLTVLFIGFSMVELIISDNLGNALSQLLMIFLFITSFFIGEYLKKSCDTSIYINASKFYIVGTFSLALQIMIQAIMIPKTGIIIGHYNEFGLRKARAGLMGDFSFASVYLASGILFILVLYVETKRIKFYQMVLLEGVHLAGLILTTARTGLYALILTVGIFFIYNIAHKKRVNIKSSFIILLTFMMLPAIFNILNISRGGQGFLDGSGRYQNYIAALKAFVDHCLIGIGFGREYVGEVIGGVVPHNFLIQYLLQCGIIGTTLILFYFLLFIRRDIGRAGIVKWLFFMVAVSAMAIPDIVCSRFLYAIVSMVMISTVYERTRDIMKE